MALINLKGEQFKILVTDITPDYLLSSNIRSAANSLLIYSNDSKNERCLLIIDNEGKPYLLSSTIPARFLNSTKGQLDINKLCCEISSLIIPESENTLLSRKLIKVPVKDDDGNIIKDDDGNEIFSDLYVISDKAIQDKFDEIFGMNVSPTDLKGTYDSWDDFIDNIGYEPDLDNGGSYDDIYLVDGQYVTWDKNTNSWVLHNPIVDQLQRLRDEIFGEDYEPVEKEDGTVETIIDKIDNLRRDIFGDTDVSEARPISENEEDEEETLIEPQLPLKQKLENDIDEFKIKVFGTNDLANINYEEVETGESLKDKVLDFQMHVYGTHDLTEVNYNLSDEELQNYTAWTNFDTVKDKLIYLNHTLNQTIHNTLGVKTNDQYTFVFNGQQASLKDRIELLEKEIERLWDMIAILHNGTIIYTGSNDSPESTSITDIVLSSNGFNATLGSTYQLTATVQPTNTTDDKTIIWTIGDLSILSFTYGSNTTQSGTPIVLTANKIGSTTITATSSNGKSKTITGTVINAQVQSISWVETTRSSKKGSNINWPNINVQYSNGTTETIAGNASGVTHNPEITSSSESGEYSIRATYQNKTTDNQLIYTIEPDVLVSIEWETTSASSTQGQSLVFPRIKLHYESGDIGYINANNATLSPSITSNSEPREYLINATYEGKTTQTPLTYTIIAQNIYYWYAGQTPPTSISGTPIVDDTNFTNNKWHTIGTTLTNIGKLVTGGTRGDEWYVAVPKDKYQPTASDLSTPDNAWTIIDTINVGAVQYSVYDPGNDSNRCSIYLKVINNSGSNSNHDESTETIEWETISASSTQGQLLTFPRLKIHYETGDIEYINANNATLSPQITLNSNPGIYSINATYKGKTTQTPLTYTIIEATGIINNQTTYYLYAGLIRPTSNDNIFNQLIIPYNEWKNDGIKLSQNKSAAWLEIGNNISQFSWNEDNIYSLNFIKDNFNENNDPLYIAIPYDNNNNILLKLYNINNTELRSYTFVQSIIVNSINYYVYQLYLSDYNYPTLTTNINGYTFSPTIKYYNL